ncbi:MAG: 3-dehydroquinate synthase II [Deltaproteobacteria bacterium]|nr:3-dehydroquinate synthase II [Deltaproteobacteria bacterium]
MKEIWVNADPWKAELVTAALEAGADAVVVSPDKVASVKGLGLIKTVSSTGDIRWGEDAFRIRISSAEDEEQIVRLARNHKKVVVETADWKIVPIENLIARNARVFLEVADMDEVRTASGILEKGVHGFVITNPEPTRVREMILELKAEHGRIELTPLEIRSIRPLGMGDRVCVDTCSLMGVGEGCLVGNSSRAFFLIQAESLDNPYVSSRPFRVNAGPVHAYILATQGRTRYLSELESGDEVLRVDGSGRASPLVVGRIKIERRPLLLIEAIGPGGPATMICQNAETVRLVTPAGDAVSVVELRSGIEVWGHIEKPGRHFGHNIRETVLEK